MYSMRAIMNIVGNLFFPLRREKPKVSEETLDFFRGSNLQYATLAQGFPSG